MIDTTSWKMLVEMAMVLESVKLSVLAAVTMMLSFMLTIVQEMQVIASASQRSEWLFEIWAYVCVVGRVMIGKTET